MNFILLFFLALIISVNLLHSEPSNNVPADQRDFLAEQKNKELELKAASGVLDAKSQLSFIKVFSTTDEKKLKKDSR